MSYQWNNHKKLQMLQASGKDSVLYFKTPTETVEVYISDNDIGRIICFANDSKVVIDSTQYHHLVVGEGNTKRDVFHYLKPGGPTAMLRLGITKHSGVGTWSSLPHKFELNPEPGFEEVFFYLLQGKLPRAIQIGKGLWYDGTPVDEVWLIRDRTFCTIPMGYHPVVGESETHVSYIWAYLAKKKEWEKI